MGWIRLIARLTAFSAFLAGTCALAITLGVADLFRKQPIDRAPWSAFCFRRACRVLGFRVQVHGSPSETNALFVANHISWSDIPILGYITPLRFLSKAEVGSWPIIGWLARQAGTLFIQRGSGQARRVKTEISRCLKAGESVLVFPEGTTSSGVAVLPIHGFLLAAARDSAHPVQPITIGYRRNQRPDPIAPFIDDDSFHTHLIRLLKQPPTLVDVIIHPVIASASTESLNELTLLIHQQISSGLRRIHSGEFDTVQEAPIRTEVAPELPRLR